MPLPTTRNAGGDVGSSREYRPGVAPCSHAKVGGTVRCGEPPARTIGYAAATYFRRPDVPTILRHRARGRRMVLILDNARYHHARSLRPFLAAQRAGVRL